MKAVLTDLSVLSSLLLIGFFLRKKVKLFQDIYIPASLLAGFVGLIFGPQILGKISPVCIPISDTVSGWAGQLVNIVLGLSFLGNTESKKDFGRTALSAVTQGGIDPPVPGLRRPRPDDAAHAAVPEPSHRLRPDAGVRLPRRPRHGERRR